MRSAAHAIRRSGLARRAARTTARPTLIAMAMSTATRKMASTPWSNIVWASAAGVPAWIIRRSKVDCATTSTPTTMTAMAMSATSTETTVIPVARLRSRRIYASAR